ncbi:hypothetical protein [Streptomyces sp. NPDC001401]|uniref:hypothetical protein n=1 Tax=Streptomyces sp. NPDC001401 TaxID=3364570 RepID=UPI0036984BE7
MNRRDRLRAGLALLAGMQVLLSEPEPGAYRSGNGDRRPDGADYRAGGANSSS